jgi:uncharacterized OsmC-like protein
MNESLVKKLDEDDLSLPGLAAAPDLLAQQLAPTTLRVPIKVKLWTEEGMRKRARVTPGVEGFSVFELLSDEGTSFPAGTDSAPAPLDYFAVGAAFCLASHLTLLINQKHLDVRQFKMESELCFSSSQEGQWQCLGLRTLVDLDSDEPAERIRELVSEAKGLCLAEEALMHPIPIQTSMSICGTLLEADVPPTSGTLHPPADANTIIQDR